jgi:hypothetical protein
MGGVVRLPGGVVKLQDAVDAVLDQHDLARSTQRLHGASLASLVAGLGPAGTNLPLLLARSPTRLGALPGTLCPPRTRGGRPPSR